MIIYREITPHLTKLATLFPVVAVMGPRQSGKTTLVRSTFSRYTYVSLEDLDMRLRAKEDPRHFFETYEQHEGVIIDEIQEVPELFSYMQGIVDKEHRPGRFIITGSQNFLLYEKITQSLAGRIALLTLLPLTVSELERAGLVGESMESLLLQGFYPRIYAQNIPAELWFSNYISTYIEKDVRQVLNIGNVLAFQQFLKLCAARTGNLLNFSELARDCDMSPNTAKAWFSVLETSYLAFSLAPYYKNFNKRIIKSPKLYLYDTGLICTLLGIRTAEELLLHPARGAIFETFVMSELFKHRYNQAQKPHLYFWRDVQGHEIDCIIEKSFDTLIPIEIKARRTLSDDFFKGVHDWKNITESPDVTPYIVYAGNENLSSQNGHILSWRSIQKMVEEIYK